MRLVFVLVVQIDCIALFETELVNQTAAEDRLAASKIHIGPIPRTLLHAIHGYRFFAIAFAAIVLQRIHGEFLGLGDCVSAVVGRIHRMHVFVVKIEVGHLVDHIDHVVARRTQIGGNAIELAIERILRLRESVLGILRLLHGFKRRLDLQRFRRGLQGISLFLSIVGSVFKSRKPGALHTLQRIGGFPRFALVTATLKLQRRLQRILVLRNNGIVQILGVVAHRGKNREREQQQQARKANAHEQRGEVAQIAQEHAQAESRGEAQPLGQREPTLHAALARFVAKELKGRMTHLAQQADKRNQNQNRHRHNGGLEENAPAPGRIIRRQAV